MLLVKFYIAHKIAWQEWDPVSGIILALSTGAYGLGAGLYGMTGKIEPLRFVSFMKLTANGLLGQCRALVCQVR